MDLFFYITSHCYSSAAGLIQYNSIWSVSNSYVKNYCTGALGIKHVLHFCKFLFSREYLALNGLDLTVEAHYKKIAPTLFVFLSHTLTHTNTQIDATAAS